MNYLKLSLAGLVVAIGALFTGVDTASAQYGGWRGGYARGPVYRAPVYRGYPYAYGPRVYTGYRGNYYRGGSGVIVSPRGIGIRF